MNDQAEAFVENAGLIKELEGYLEEYDRVILVVEIAEEKFMETLYSFCRHNVTSKRILLLSTEVQEVTEGMIRFHPVSKKDRNILLRLYDTYEFSDRFCVISKHSTYGGLFNYLHTGWLSIDELLQCIFGC